MCYMYAWLCQAVDHLPCVAGVVESVFASSASSELSTASSADQSLAPLEVRLRSMTRTTDFSQDGMQKETLSFPLCNNVSSFPRCNYLVQDFLQHHGSMQPYSWLRGICSQNKPCHLSLYNQSWQQCSCNQVQLSLHYRWTHWHTASFHMLQAAQGFHELNATAVCVCR